MFDEIECHVPLPDGGTTANVIFQTKTFPDACICRYVITTGGRLVDQRDRDLEPDGFIQFYTQDRVDALHREDKWREYRARFCAGQLESIECVNNDEPPSRHYGLASFRWYSGEEPVRANAGPRDIL